MNCNRDYIKWNILINRNDLVEGIAVVKNGFKAELHYHSEEEEYVFLHGIGKLYNDGNVNIIRSPYNITIKSNSIHAMTPISDYVILLFRFRKGKFENIKYTYTNKYLENKMKSKL
tara:strand:+ start:878 stop:1225 length:348 start_codon:yes stop_codon:yes gene_type:complete